MLSQKPDYYTSWQKANACSNKNIQHSFENVKSKSKVCSISEEDIAAALHMIQTLNEKKGSLCTCFFGLCVDFS